MTLELEEQGSSTVQVLAMASLHDHHLRFDISFMDDAVASGGGGGAAGQLLGSTGIITSAPTSLEGWVEGISPSVIVPQGS